MPPGFQSSPAPRRGCYACPCPMAGALSGFNPHPRRGAGAAFLAAQAGQRKAVSILTRAEARVLRGFYVEAELLKAVSILTRAEARVLPPTLTQNYSKQVVSILTRAEARVLRLRLQRVRVQAQVSILTRAEARVLRGCTTTAVARLRFQSSPAPRRGCCNTFARLLTMDGSFNPHPRRGAGAAMRRGMLSRTGYRFQSSPAPRRGCCDC